MARFTCKLLAASSALYGASCFILPSTGPRSAPDMDGTVAQAFEFETAAPETTSSSSFSPLALGAALGLMVAVMGSRPALAVDLENGETVFQGNCAACHSGGNNSIVAEKKLKKDALITYGKYDVAAIIKQVTNGNGAMPAFGEKLGPDDIEDVANYVYNKADKW
jgi:cytochrome c6